MGNYYEPITSKNYSRCSKCYKAMSKGKVCFKMKESFSGTTLYLCCCCVKIEIVKELENLQNKVLDLKNLLGTVEIMIDQ